MGQKVHPQGFRIGVTKTWDSRWMFSDKKVFRESLLEDILIREALMKQFNFSIVSRVEIERAINKLVITIHAVKPGMLIGRGGKGLEDVKQLIVSIMKKKNIEKDTQKIDIKIEPVKKPYLSSFYVASDIAGKLARNLPHRLIVHQALDRVMDAGAKGVKIQLGGRIGGATISRTEKYSQGSVPTSTIREDIDYTSYASKTRSGYVGVKVWVARQT